MCGTYPLDDDVFPQRGYCGPASIRIRVQNIQKYIDAVSGPRSTAYDRLTLAHMAVSYYSLLVVSLQSIVTLKSLAEGLQKYAWHGKLPKKQKRHPVHASNIAPENLGCGLRWNCPRPRFPE